MATPTSASTRRDFLAQSTQTAAVVTAGGLVGCAGTPGGATAAAAGRIIGANDRINLAVMGIRGRGGSLAKSFAKMDKVCVKTLVDVDENLFAKRVNEIEKIQKVRPGTEVDIRKALADKDIDAVVVATPNHWHALATIWACQAGKHVYTEKPNCHNIHEGRKMVEAAEKYGVIVAVGFQNRTIKNVRNAMAYLKSGALGDIYMAKGLCFKPRDSIGRYPDSAVPAGVHYDLWLGPAPKRPFNKNRFHYNWHWHWDYGNGDIGNQGPHQFDVARWGLGKDEHPVRIQSMGGYFAFDCAQETANTQIATFEYADGKLLQFEVRGLYTNGEDDIRIGNLFYGTKGWMHLNGSQWKTYFGRKNKPGPTSSSKDVEAAADPMNLTGAGGSGHFANFIAALRSGRKADLTCPIEVGNRSCALPHLANISYRLKRQLNFDGAKEKFLGDAEADAYLTRPYREGFVVPEQV